MKFWLFSFLCSVVLVVPEWSLASTVIRTGETVTVTQDQVVEGDFYSSSNRLIISGEVTGDAVVAAMRSVTVNGGVGADLHVLSPEVGVFGAVEDDIRVVGGIVTIADQVGGDVVVFAGTLNILSSATIAGDVVFYGGDGNIAGAVAGSVLGTMNSIRLDGAVMGDVEVSATDVIFGEKANIVGDVRYTSAVVATRAASANVSGVVTRNEPSNLQPQFNPRAYILPFLISLFSVLVWHLFAARNLSLVLIAATTRWQSSFLVGFGVLLFAPLAIVIMSATLIGSVIGIAFLGIFIATVFLGMAAAGGVIAQFLRQRVKAIETVWLLVLGTVVMHVLWFVPIVGSVAVFVTVIIAIGAITRLGYNTLRAPEPALE